MGNTLSACSFQFVLMHTKNRVHIHWALLNVNSAPLWNSFVPHIATFIKLKVHALYIYKKKTISRIWTHLHAVGMSAVECWIIYYYVINYLFTFQSWIRKVWLLFSKGGQKRDYEKVFTSALQLWENQQRLCKSIISVCLLKKLHNSTLINLLSLLVRHW